MLFGNILELWEFKVDESTIKEVEIDCAICGDKLEVPCCSDCDKPLMDLCAACSALAQMIDFYAFGLNENATKFYHGLADYCLRERDNGIKSSHLHKEN